MSWFWRKFKKIPEPTMLFCECNDINCLLLLPLEEQEYLGVRARRPKAAIVLPGHENDVDNILERHEGYLVVQQIGS